MIAYEIRPRCQTQSHKRERDTRTHHNVHHDARGHIAPMTSLITVNVTRAAHIQRRSKRHHDLTANFHGEFS